MRETVETSTDLEALRVWIRAPLAIQVSACGNGQAPQSVRGFGVSFDDTGALCVGVVDAQATELLAALRLGQPVAVNLTHPLTFRGRQLKGPLLTIGEPSTQAAEAAREYFTRFVASLAQIGMTEEQCRGMFKTGATRVIRMQPEQLFNQTPGTDAGARL